MENKLQRFVMSIDHLEDLWNDLDEDKGLSRITTNNGTIYLNHHGCSPDMKTEIYLISMDVDMDDLGELYVSDEAYEEHKYTLEAHKEEEEV